MEALILLGIAAALAVPLGSLFGFVAFLRLRSTERRLRVVEDRLRSLEPAPMKKPREAATEPAPGAPREEPSTPRPEPPKPAPESKREPEPALVYTRAPEPEKPAAAASPSAPESPESIPESQAEPPKAEKPAEPVHSDIDFETRIGAVWLNRIGLAALIVSFALLGRYIHPHLAAWHKVAVSYAAAFALLGVGKIFEKTLRQFARPVMAGGIALAFFTSYAAHFLEPMACLSLWPSLALMTLSIGGLFWAAERWKSESTAGLAIFLGHLSAYVAGGTADSFTLAAILFLNLSAVALLFRHNWAPLTFFAVLASYGSHFLWATQDHPPVSDEFSFWLNFSFLSSYYVIFLAADLLAHARLREEPEALGAAGRTAARGAGMVSLVLYTTLAGIVFYGTGVYWDRIHYFLIPLSALQAWIMTFYQNRGHATHPFYAVSATMLLTLGLFSCMGGLSLNMALAAEALILLILARTLRFWALAPLAQIVLMVNYIHFWFSDAHRVETAALYFGVLTTASVYLAKARLQETWRDRAPDWPEPEWLRMARLGMGKVMKPAAYFHAALGGTLLVYGSIRFFEVPWEGAAFAALFLTVSAAAFFFDSRALIAAVWVIQCGLFPHASGMMEASDNWTVANTAWFAHQGTVIAIALAATGMVAAAKRWNRPAFAVAGLGSLGLLAPAAIHAFAPETAAFRAIPLWMIPPLAYGFAAWFAEKRIDDNFAALSGVPASAGKWIGRPPFGIAPAAGLFGAVLLLAHADRMIESSAVLCWFAVAASLVTAGIAAGARSLALSWPAGLLLLASHGIYYVRFDPMEASADTPILTAALIAAMLAAGAAAEWFGRNRAKPVSDSGKTALFGQACAAHVLAIIMGNFFMHAWGDDITGSNYMIYAFKMLFPLALFAGGWMARLGWLQVAAYAYGFGWLAPSLLTGPHWMPPGTGGMLIAGLSMFAQMAIIERILAIQGSEAVLEPAPNAGRWMRRAAVLFGAAFMVGVMGVCDEMRGYWTTAGWSGLAFVHIVAGFAWRDQTYRRAGLGLFGLAVLKIVLVDIAQLESVYRIVTFLSLGVCMIVVSYLYARFKEQLKQWF